MGFKLTHKRPKLTAVLIVWFSIPFFLQATSAVHSAANVTTIRILEKSQIEKDKILLGKISEIKGDNPELIQRLRTIVIGKSPLPGRSRRIDEQYVKVRLKQSNIDLSRVVLEFPKRSIVSRDFIEISKEEIKRTVEDFIFRNNPWDSDRARIKGMQVNRNVILPKGKITYKIVQPKHKNFIGKIPLSVHFYVNGRFQKRVWATVHIEVLTEVVVTRRPLRRYQPITEDDIVRKTRDLADLPSNYISSFEEVLGKRTKRKMNAGVVLRSDLIGLPPLVSRGDVVSIVAETKGLRITALGIVKENGYRGGVVRVVNLDSKKGIYARVMDPNTVKVSF